MEERYQRLRADFIYNLELLDERDGVIRALLNEKASLIKNLESDREEIRERDAVIRELLSSRSTLEHEFNSSRIELRNLQQSVHDEEQRRRHLDQQNQSLDQQIRLATEQLSECEQKRASLDAQLLAAQDAVKASETARANSRGLARTKALAGAEERRTRGRVQLRRRTVG